MTTLERLNRGNDFIVWCFPLEHPPCVVVVTPGIKREGRPIGDVKISQISKLPSISIGESILSMCL